MLERLAREKHSNLLQKFLTYGCKKFYNIGTWCQAYKNFSSARNDEARIS
jgi:hypothetical protein